MDNYWKRRYERYRRKEGRLKLKYKPKDFKDVLLLQRLEEENEQLIQKITDAELSKQGILMFLDSSVLGTFIEYLRVKETKILKYAEN